jgi:hypothetical protein
LYTYQAMLLNAKSLGCLVDAGTEGPVFQDRIDPRMTRHGNRHFDTCRSL